MLTMTSPGIFALVLLFAGSAPAADLKINISGFRNQTGQGIVYLWKAAGGFPKETEKSMANKTSPIAAGGLISVMFEGLAAGTYGITVVHDENSNGKMDTGFLGKPKEGYGASNNPKNKITPPSFDQAKFALDDAGKMIEIGMRY